MSATGAVIAGGAAAVGLGLAYVYFKKQASNQQTASTSQSTPTSYTPPTTYKAPTNTGCNANGQFGTLVGNGADFGSSSAYDAYEQSFNGGYYLSLVDPKTCQLIGKFQHSGSFSVYARPSPAQSTASSSGQSAQTQQQQYQQQASSSSGTHSRASSGSSSTSTDGSDGCIYVNHICYSSWYDYHLQMQQLAEAQGKTTAKAAPSQGSSSGNASNPDGLSYYQCILAGYGDKCVNDSSTPGRVVKQVYTKQSFVNTLTNENSGGLTGFDL